MAVVVACPNGHRLRVKDEFVGKTVQCPQCGQTFKTAGAGPAPRSTPASTPNPVLAALDEEQAGADESPSIPTLHRARTVPGQSRDRRATPRPEAWKLPVLIGGGVFGVLALLVLVVILTRGPGTTPPAPAAPTTPATITPGGATAVTPSGSARDSATPVSAAPEATELNVVARANSGPVKWSVEPDPAPAPNGQPASQAIALPVQGSFAIRQVAFSSPATAQAIVLTGTKLSELRVDRFDLATGASLAGFAGLFSGDDAVFAPIAGAASPDGGQFVHRDPKVDSRLHVWNLSDGKHIANWVPYASDSKKAVVWTAMTEPNRVLTLNHHENTATLVLWQLPECRPVYAVGNVAAGYLNPGQAVAFSPGRKYVAAFNGQSYELFNAATGERCGQTDPPPGPRVASCSAVAFRPDGGALAAVLQTSSAGQAALQLVQWDLKTGKLVSQFPLPPLKWSVRRETHGLPIGNSKAWSGDTPLSLTMTWWGPGHVLLDASALMDLERKEWIWRYAAASHASGGADARCWFATAANNRTYLMNVELPDQEIRSLLASADDPQGQALVRPGSKVSLRLEFTGPPTEANEFRQKLSEQLTAQLRGVGLTVEDGQPATLLVQVQVAELGRTMTYRVFGGAGRPSEVNVSLKKLDCRVAYVDRQGKAAWQTETSFTNSPTMTFGQGDIASQVLDQQWAEFAEWLGRHVTVPHFGSASGTVLPGNSVITPDGITKL